MIVRDFDLIGPTLRVQAEEEQLVDRFAGLLRGLAAKGAQEPSYTLSLKLGTPRPTPTTAELIYEGPIFWEGDCSYVADGELLHLSFPGRISLVIDPAANAAEIVVAADSIPRVAATPGMLAIDAAIDASGQFMLHAAGLTLPGSDSQVLVFAQSGTGKTTTSLALAEMGFGLCTDDSMVIRTENGTATGWGLPRDLKVHHKTAAMLPWLEPFLAGTWNDEGEQAVTRAALSERIRVERTARRPIVGIFLLERGDVVESEVVPLSPTATLESLGADKGRTVRTGLRASPRRRFASLAALASSAPTFKVTVGSKPQSTADAIASAIRQTA